jgi:hypothetical protein
MTTIQVHVQEHGGGWRHLGAIVVPGHMMWHPQSGEPDIWDIAHRFGAAMIRPDERPVFLLSTQNGRTVRQVQGVPD